MNKDQHIVGIIDDDQTVVAYDYSDVRKHHIEKITAKHNESETVIIIDDIININEGDKARNEENKPMGDDRTLIDNVINSNEGERLNEIGGNKYYYDSRKK